MAHGAFARDLALGPPAKMRFLWSFASLLAFVVEAWLVLVASGYAALGGLLVGFALTMRWRADVHADRIAGLIYSPAGHWYCQCKQGARIELNACKTLVLPHAVFASFRCGATSGFGLALTRAAAGAEDFRRLRVRLRHVAPADNRRN